MMETVDRNEVQRLVREKRAQVIEVLLQPEYGWAHLPGARHMPLMALTAETVADLDRNRPVIANGSNTGCDLSPRAVADRTPIVTDDADLCVLGSVARSDAQAALGRLRR